MTFEPEIFPTSMVIKSLCPNAVIAVDEDEKGEETIRWIDMKGDSKPTDSQITAKRNELKAAYGSKKYQRDREVEYPTFGDQLDNLYKDILAGKVDATGEFAKAIKSVKDANPKP